MRKVLAVACLLVVLMAGQASARSWRWNECRFQMRDGKPGFSVTDVQQTIRCAAAKFGVSVDTAFYIANRESHFGALATNPTSGACGVYQNIPRYWPTRRLSFLRAQPRYANLGPSCYNGRSNVLVALWMAGTSGWGPWGM